MIRDVDLFYSGKANRLVPKSEVFVINRGITLTWRSPEVE